MAAADRGTLTGSAAGYHTEAKAHSCDRAGAGRGSVDRHGRQPALAERAPGRLPDGRRGGADLGALLAGYQNACPVFSTSTVAVFCMLSGALALLFLVFRRGGLDAWRN